MPEQLPMGLGEFVDLVQHKCWKEAFVTGRQILYHCSYRRMPAWIDALAKIMVEMGRGGELPETFS